MSASFFPSGGVWESMAGTLLHGEVFFTPYVHALVISCICTWLGVHLFLRGMAMAGDAVSHSVLPGMVAAYAVTGQVRGFAPFLGAGISGWLSVWVAGRLARVPRMRADAALGAVYGIAFGLGVLGVGVLGRNVHLDAECVLNGDLLLVEGDGVGSVWVGPLGLALIGGCLDAMGGKRLRMTAFDAGFSRAGGIRVGVWNGLVVVMLTVTSVLGFRAMGILPVLVMTTVPVAAGWAWGGGYRMRLFVALAVTVFSVTAGFLMAIWMEVAPPPAMGVAAFIALGGIVLLRREREVLARAR